MLDVLQFWWLMWIIPPKPAPWGIGAPRAVVERRRIANWWVKSIVGEDSVGIWRRNMTWGDDETCILMGDNDVMRCLINILSRHSIRRLGSQLYNRCLYIACRVVSLWRNSITIEHFLTYVGFEVPSWTTYKAGTMASVSITSIAWQTYIAPK